jgi:hypothetical protein
MTNTTQHINILKPLAIPEAVAEFRQILRRVIKGIILE